MHGCMDLPPLKTVLLLPMLMSNNEQVCNQRIYISVYVLTAACMLISQHACTADHNMPSLHQLALPCPSYISHSLHTQTTHIYIYVAIHALASMPSAPRLSEADSKTSTEVPLLICNQRM
jgi:hypothetical protein